MFIPRSSRRRWRDRLAVYPETAFSGNGNAYTLGLRRRAFVITTDSAHGFAIYPNLVPQLDVSGLDQLWVADITNIRLLRELIYLEGILDAYSRRCIGWVLGDTLRAEVTIAQLEMELERRDGRGTDSSVTNAGLSSFEIGGGY